MSGPPPITEEALRIAAVLSESNAALVQTVLDVLGAERTNALLMQTLEVEASGGMLVQSGKRRRSPGGVFFYLARTGVSKQERRSIFGAQGEASPPKKTPPTWEQAGAAAAWAQSKDARKGEARVVNLTVIGRPKQVKKMDTCVILALTPKGPPPLPAGLPTAPEGAGVGTVIVFVANKQWAKAAAFLQQDAEDELIVEGYPLFDPKGQSTILLAKQCVSKGQQRAAREKKE